MSKSPQFTLSFNLKITNEERLEAFELYKKAFNAKKLSEGTPPDGDDIHIMMEIYGFQVLLGPGDTVGKGFDHVVTCEVRFNDKQDFRRAYDVLAQQAQNSSLEGPYPWATLLGLVTDKFGVGWTLYFNE